MIDFLNESGTHLIGCLMTYLGGLMTCPCGHNDSPGWSLASYGVRALKWAIVAMLWHLPLTKALELLR